MNKPQIALVALLGGLAAAYFALKPSLNDLSIYDTAQWWDDDSPFVILRRMNDVRVPFFLSRFPSKRHHPVIVDAGCGGGLVAEAIAQAGFAVTGIDISAPSIAVASAHAPPSLNLTYIVGSVYRLPFESDSVDVVIISDVLEHLSDVPAAVSEIFRVLKPNGVLVFDTIARTWWSYLSTYLMAQEVLGIVASGAHDWSMFIDPNELGKILNACGFKTDRNLWAGIVPNLSFFKALQTGSLINIITGFRFDKTDFSSSYMGFATKPAPSLSPV